MKTESIIHDITSCTGADESSRVYQYTCIHTGETQLVIEKTVTERYPVQEYEKVMDLHKAINAGGGRKRITLKDFTKR